MVILLAMTPMAAFAEEPWRFIVTCDSRGYTDGIEQIILREIAAETIDQGADFVLFPGDLVYGSSATDPSGFESQLGAGATTRFGTFGVFTHVPISTLMTIMRPAGSPFSAMTCIPSRSCRTTVLRAKST